MRVHTVLVVAAGLLGFVGCDGGNGNGDGAAQVADGDVPFCDAYGALLSGPLADAATDAADPSVLQDAVTTTEALVADLVAAAPDEVAGAALELEDDYESTFAVLERYGFDLARLDAEATDEEHAVLDGFGQAVADPGDGSPGRDPFAELQRFVADRCAPEVTLPPELRETTTSP